MDIADIAPTDWHRTRYIRYIPQHFKTLKTEHDIGKVLVWLANNTTGRFGVEDTETLSEGLVNLMDRDEEYLVGFENPADATMFALFFK